VIEEVRDKLLALNRTFYADFAQPFAETRANPQPGFERMLAHVPHGCERVLDVGCGEGRLGRFLLAAMPHLAYVGVDFSQGLLDVARRSLGHADLLQRDIQKAGSLSGLGRFGFVACLAVLQHIPTRVQRVGLLREMGDRLGPDGRVAVSTWQFMDSERQRRKVVDWETVSISPRDVEEGDYLLSWRAGGYGLRYVAHIGLQDMVALARDAGLVIVESYRSDGKEGDLNLYTILARLESDAGLS
jgi:tRNA (uracil-5-)-methyltransferase TRM9